MHGHDDEVKPRRVLSSAGRQGRISQLRATLRECNRIMEPMDSHLAAELQRLEREERDCAAYEASISTPATVQHKCARCDAVLESSPIPPDFERNLAAHQERCFRPGDPVRWEWNEHGRWAQGTFVSAQACEGWTRYTMTVSVTSAGNWGEQQTPAPGKEHQFGVTDGRQSIRRIPRPERKGELAALEQYEAAARKIAENRIDPASWNPVGINAHIVTDSPHAKTITGTGFEQHRRSEHTPQCTYFDSVDAPCTCEPAPPDPLDTKYDGVTLRALVAASTGAARDRMTPLARAGLTPAQRGAISAHWSAELRAKVSASKDAEQRRVVVDLQDDEENPW